ncbi:hypothetical protein J3F83DRAFT_444882 [Trichoderma novae-zelandiae]
MKMKSRGQDGMLLLSASCTTRVLLLPLLVQRLTQTRHAPVVVRPHDCRSPDRARALKADMAWATPVCVLRHQSEVHGTNMQATLGFFGMLKATHGQCQTRRHWKGEARASVMPCVIYAQCQVVGQNSPEATRVPPRCISWDKNYPPMTGLVSSSLEARWSSPVLCRHQALRSIIQVHWLKARSSWTSIAGGLGSCTINGLSIRGAAASRCQQLALPGTLYKQLFFTEQSPLRNTPTLAMLFFAQQEAMCPCAFPLSFSRWYSYGLYMGSHVAGCFWTFSPPVLVSIQLVHQPYRCPYPYP